MSDARLLSPSQLNSTIIKHLDDGRLIDAAQVFHSNTHLRDLLSWNLMLSGYIRNGHAQRAHKLYDEMPCRDAVSWNAILSSFKRSGDSFTAFQHFTHRVDSHHHNHGIPNGQSGASAPRGCTGFSCNSIVGTALIGAYAGRKDPIAMRRRAFDDIPIKNSVSWTSLIVGYMQLGRLKEAECAFGKMPAKNVVSWTAMINGFIDNGHLDEARRCFAQMSFRNVVTSTSMIKGWVPGARAARRCSKLVRRDAPAQWYPPQPVHRLCRACCLCRLLLPPARQICPWANPEMQGAMGCDLVQLPSRDVCQMWRRGFCHPILRVIPSPQLEEFERMIRECVRPPITSLRRRLDGLRARWVGEGRMEHYGCMVDLLGRAEKLIGRMPFEPDAVVWVWGALLGACGLQSSLEHGMAAAESIHRLDENHPAIYSMLLRIYGENGAWRKVDEVKETMEKMVVGKQRAPSWVESAAASCGL
ncbi:unnamed protein product [Musa acuminata var. zebrina]